MPGAPRVEDARRLVSISAKEFHAAYEKARERYDKYTWNNLDYKDAVEAILAAHDEEKEGKKTMGRSKSDDKAFDNIDVEIRREGRELVLPGEPVPMTYQAGIKMLERKIEEEETEVAVNEQVTGFWLDSAVAFAKAMRRIYGWAQAVPTPTFFGPEPPRMLDVETGVNERTKVIWGSFQLPNIAGRLETRLSRKGRQALFTIAGSTKRKHLGAIAELADLTRQIVREESIYRGKAFTVPVDDNGNISNDPTVQPSFIDTSKVDPAGLVFPEITASQVDTLLLAPIRHTEAARRLGIPLKRGVLLAGPFGTGKTLTAAVTARIAEENGWTYITAKTAKAVANLAEFARLYQPSVIFVEDVDSVLGGERNEDMNTILNTIDGVLNKGDAVITVLTTNNVEAIHQAMLRPGRLDAVIMVDPPDRAAAERLMRMYGRGLIPEDEALDGAARELAGQIPATIREVVERSKLAALHRAGGGGGDFYLLDADLTAAARGMKHHLDLLNRPLDRVLSPAEKLGQAMAELVSRAVSGEDAETEHDVDDVFEVATDTESRVMALHESVSELKAIAAESGGGGGGGGGGGLPADAARMLKDTYARVKDVQEDVEEIKEKVS